MNNFRYRKLHGVVIEKFPFHSSGNYYDHHGDWYGTSITARVYVNGPHIFRGDLVPSVLKDDYNAVLNYKGFFEWGIVIAYIYEYYCFRLADINRIKYPLLYDNRLNHLAKNITDSVAELRNKVSMHRIFKESDVVIVSIHEDSVVAKIDIVEEGGQPNIRQQLARDFTSIRNIIYFFVGSGEYSIYAEGQDLLDRLYQRGNYDQNLDLYIAFESDAQAILKHAACWAPNTSVDFMVKVGTIFFDHVNRYHHEMLDNFRAAVDEEPVGKWKADLDQEAYNQVLGVAESNTVHFIIGLRHLMSHFTKIRLGGQNELAAYGGPLWLKLNETNPLLLMRC